MASGLNGYTSGSRTAAQSADTEHGTSEKSFLEPLAIVGMAFNMPQGANSDEKLWRMLVNKRNTMTEWPEDRMNVDAFYHPDPFRTNTMTFRGGHFLDTLPDTFDAPFFSIGAAEAAALDPAHRITLEATFQSLENDDYKTLAARDTEHISPYHTSGNTSNMLSNRISWFFNLSGVSATIDTACSSSMTAFDLACRTLQTGETSMSLVTGANILLDALNCMHLSNMNFCSPDSKSQSFDHRANGYGRGEGVGVLVLKRLSDALKANDTIRAVVRATGSNQDGRTPGITQPSSSAQEQLIKDTYAKAGLDMSITRFVEAHGTDPIPWPDSGLRRASVSSFGYGGSNSHVVLDDAYNYLKLHGLRGNHWSVPQPTRRALNGLQLPPLSIRNDHNEHTRTKQLLVWSAADQNGISRMATAFSEFARARSDLTDEQKIAYLQHMAYTLSERRSLFSWRAFAVVENLDDLNDDLAAKMSRPIKRLTDGRLGFVFTGQGAQYPQMAQDLLSCPVFLESLRKSEQVLKKLGAHWSLIDKLLDPAERSCVNEPAFSQPLCTAVQIALIDVLKSVEIYPSVVLGHSSGEIAAAYAVGGLSHDSACKVAYFRGVCANDLLAQQTTPMAMMSVGLSESEVVPYLDRVQEHFGSIHVVVACVNGPDNVTVSGIASQIDWLQTILAEQEVFARKLRVNVAYHSPLMKMLADQYLDLMGQLQEGNASSEPMVMVSSVTGALASIEELKSPHYWIENMIQPVRFSAALAKACGLKRSTLVGSKAIINDIVEIGPHSALQGPIKTTLKSTSFKEVGYFPTLVRNVSATRSVLELCGNIFSKGYTINLAKVTSNLGSANDNPMVLPDLPYYSFDHSRKYWHESRVSSEGFRKRKFPRLDLLGTPAPDWNPLLARWTNVLRISELPWITDHKINGAILYPAAGMLVMALEAAKQLADPERSISGYLVKDVVFARALAVSETGTRTEIVLQPAATSSRLGKDSWTFRLCTDVSEGEWQETCSGQVQVHYAVAATDTVDAGKEMQARQASERSNFENVQKQCSQRMDPQHAYGLMANLGAQYGPTFQGIREIAWDGKGNGIAEVSVYEWPSQAKADYRQEHIIHPTTLDSMIQPCFICMSNGMQGDFPVMIPTRLGSLWLREEGINHPTLETAKVHVQATLRSSRTAEVNLVAAATVPGDTLLSATGLELTAVGLNDARKGQSDVDALCYDMLWKPDLNMMDSKQLELYCNSARPQRPDASPYYEKLNHAIMMYLCNELPKDTPADIPAYFERYMSWARHYQQAFMDGTLEHYSAANSNWQALSSDPIYRTQVLKELQATPQGEFYMKIGSNLRAILEGKLDPLELLFHDRTVTDFYEDINENVICFEPLGRFFDLLTHKNPGLEILEIGAGTGSTTDHILTMLETEPNADGTPGYTKFSRYDYTDVSPAFFENANAKYARHSARMRYFVYDMEKDPSSQGISVGTYDVIIAGSCLHVTPDMDSTIRNVRKLLKPGGKLIFYEPVKEQVRVAFAFGLLPGWWLGKDENRRLRPWLHREEWDDLLNNTGFSGVELEIMDYEDQRCHELSFMVTTAVPETQLRPQAPQISILVGEMAEQAKVASALQERLNTSGYDCAIAPFGSLAQEDQFSERMWVSLCEFGLPVISDLDESSFNVVKKFLLGARQILWVTSGGKIEGQDPRLHVIDGLARTATTEDPRLTFITLALQPAAGSALESTVMQIAKVLEQSLHRIQRDRKTIEPEYREVDHLLHINRAMVGTRRVEEDVDGRKNEERSVHRAFGVEPPIRQGSFNLIDGFQFIVDHDHEKPLPAQHIEIKVHSTGLNFRDYLVAIGQVDEDLIGVECSGTVTRVGENCGPYRVGDRVAAITSSFQTYTQTPIHRACLIPENVAFQDACASLIVYATAYYCLAEVARLRKGESILIHSAAGGTGQASIQIAQHLGAEIYVTVGTLEKRKFLRETFGIPEDHIFSSRNQSFAQGLKRQTRGRGVDVVLNSLSGENLVASWESLAPCGRLVEIGKRDIYSHNQLPMWQFRRSCTFAAVDLDVVINEKPQIVQEVFTTIMDLMSKGVFSAPRPLRVYGVSQLLEALKSFQSGDQYGKAVVEMRHDDTVEVLAKPTPSYQFDPKKTYLIAGGLGGLGRNTAFWLSTRGARNLILLSRSGAKSEAAQELVRRLKAMGVRVETPACDISDRTALAKTLANLKNVLPPVAGCIQSAMLLQVRGT
nr:highly reducing polyketide synthase azaB-like [Quercus suber]